MPAAQRTGHLRVMLLVAIAGYVDAYGLLTFQTFVSFMSGNTTQSGAAIGQGMLAAALPGVTAILFFSVGVFAGTVIALRTPRRSQQLCFALVAALIAAYLIAARDLTIRQTSSIAILAFAMGILNTTVSRIGIEPINIGYVSGTLNRLADHLARAVLRAPLADARGPWDTHAHRALLLAGVWASFIGGAILSGAGMQRFGAGVLLLPLLLLLILTAQNPSQPFQPILWRSCRNHRS